MQHGDRIALMCENRIELLDLILGATWIGAVAVPLNTALRGEQLAHQLRELRARRVLAMDSALVEVLGARRGHRRARARCGRSTASRPTCRRG